MGQWSTGYVYRYTTANGRVWERTLSRALRPAEAEYLRACVYDGRWDDARVFVTLVEASA